jgi:hypothetical protein
VENLALWKRALAEFGAVFLLASIGLMTVATAITTGAYGLFELSIAFGFAITVMVVVSGAVSGAHFNPAITISLASLRRFPWRDVPVYIAAQISGGVVGALVLYFFFSGPIRAFEAASNITRGQPNSSLSGMIFACYSPKPRHRGRPEVAAEHRQHPDGGARRGVRHLHPGHRRLRRGGHAQLVRAQPAPVRPLDRLHHRLHHHGGGPADHGLHQPGA